MDLQAQLQAVLGDSYVVERELSGGAGVARVFVAEERLLKRRVVVKVLLFDVSAGLSVERFRREMRFAATLQHPHIVPVLTAGAGEGILYYTVPFVAGESLRTRLAREDKLPIGDVIHLLRDVADALCYAHAQGVIHRDVKPDNLLTTGGHAMVTDFGVSKAFDSATAECHLTAEGISLGTPAYMAPEQVAADPGVDHRADIYAVGATAYELLTGRPPFREARVDQVLASHLLRAPESVTQYRPSVPKALAAIVTQFNGRSRRWREDLRESLGAADLQNGDACRVVWINGAPISDGEFARFARRVMNRAVVVQKDCRVRRDRGTLRHGAQHAGIPVGVSLEQGQAFVGRVRDPFVRTVGETQTIGLRRNSKARIRCGYGTRALRIVGGLTSRTAQAYGGADDGDYRLPARSVAARGPLHLGIMASAPRRPQVKSATRSR